MNLEDELASADLRIKEYRLRSLRDPHFTPIVENSFFPNVADQPVLCRRDALQKIVVLMRLLRAEVTSEHHALWKVCATYASARTLESSAIGETFYATCAVFWGTMVPPYTQIDILIRHLLLGPTGFHILESLLRRGASPYLNLDGSARVRFSIIYPDGSGQITFDPLDAEHSHCYRLQDTYLASVLALRARTQKGNDDIVLLELLEKEIGTIFAEAIGGRSESTISRQLETWRQNWMQPGTLIVNQIPMLSLLVAFFLLLQMPDEHYAEANRAVGELSAGLHADIHP